MRMVALRKESVDRNVNVCDFAAQQAVALRKESVDRNPIGYAARRQYRVALRKESVDRNYSDSFRPFQGFQSLSARRAWIEMRLA